MFSTVEVPLIGLVVGLILAAALHQVRALAPMLLALVAVALLVVLFQKGVPGLVGYLSAVIGHIRAYGDFAGGVVAGKFLYMIIALGMRGNRPPRAMR